MNQNYALLISNTFLIAFFAAQNVVASDKQAVGSVTIDDNTKGAHYFSLHRGSDLPKPAYAPTTTTIEVDGELFDLTFAPRAWIEVRAEDLTANLIRVPQDNMAFLFNADEIVSIEDLREAQMLSTTKQSYVTRDGRHVIAQTNRFTSDAAVINMAILDRGYDVDNLLLSRHVKMSLEQMIQPLKDYQIESYGFSDRLALEQLGKAHKHLEKYSALVLLDNTEIGPQWIVLDHVSANVDEANCNAIIRNPFNRQSLTIEMKSLISRAPKIVIWIKK